MCMLSAKPSVDDVCVLKTSASIPSMFIQTKSILDIHDAINLRRCANCLNNRIFLLWSVLLVLLCIYFGLGRFLIRPTFFNVGATFIVTFITLLSRQSFITLLDAVCTSRPDMMCNSECNEHGLSTKGTCTQKESQLHGGVKSLPRPNPRSNITHSEVRAP